MQAVGLLLSARPLCLAELQRRVAACSASWQTQLSASCLPASLEHPSPSHLPLTQLARFRATIDNQGKAKKKPAAGSTAPVDGAAPAAPEAGGTNPSTTTTSTGAQTPDVAASVAPPQRATSSILRVTTPSHQLAPSQVGHYYRLQPALLPEALPALHNTFYSPRTATEHPRAAGCRGLVHEMKAVASGLPSTSPMLMHRAVTSALWGVLSRGSQGETKGQSKGAGVRMLLRGPVGSGKSCTLAALVERARASGWLAVYIPSASYLVKGGLFEPRPAAEGTSAQAQQWDTPISAQHVLLGCQQAHAQALALMPVRLDKTRRLMPAKLAGAQPAQAALDQGKKVEPAASTQQQPLAPAVAAAAGEAATATADSPAATAGSPATPVAASAAPGAGAASPPAVQALTLAQLVTHGLAADDAHTPVDVVLALLDELVAASSPLQPVLLAVDDYNTLYGETGYGRHVRPQEEGEAEGPPGLKRIPLEVEQLRLASSMRLLERPAVELGSVHVVAATSHSLGVSRRVKVPLGPSPHTQAAEVFVPRFSEVEVTHALHHYYECGTSPSPPSSTSVARMLLLTNGNATEVRQLAVTSTLLQVKGRLINQWAM